MRRLSDYKGEEAILLWGDLVEYAAPIVQDSEVRLIADHFSVQTIATKLVKAHPKEICQIIERIQQGEEEVNGLSIVPLTIALLSEIGENPEYASFFGLQGQTEEQEFSGSVTENIEEEEH